MLVGWEVMCGAESARSACLPSSSSSCHFFFFFSASSHAWPGIQIVRESMDQFFSSSSSFVARRESSIYIIICITCTLSR